MTFQPDGRPAITGMITRYNKKTVSVVTDEGQQWNVAPQLLARAAPRAIGKTDGSNVVTLPWREKPSSSKD